MTLKAGPQPPDLMAQLLVRYWGIGEQLDNDEREVLMFALATENKSLGGNIHKEASALFKTKFPKSTIHP